MDGNSSKGLTNFRLEKPLNKEKRRQLLKKSLAGGGGLSYADTIGLVICLSVLSQRIGHSEANENPSESVSIPKYQVTRSVGQSLLAVLQQKHYIFLV